MGVYPNLSIELPQRRPESKVCYILRTSFLELRTYEVMPH